MEAYIKNEVNIKVDEIDITEYIINYIDVIFNKDTNDFEFLINENSKYFHGSINNFLLNDCKLNELEELICGPNTYVYFNIHETTRKNNISKFNKHSFTIKMKYNQVINDKNLLHFDNMFKQMYNINQQFIEFKKTDENLYELFNSLSLKYDVIEKKSKNNTDKLSKKYDNLYRFMNDKQSKSSDYYKFVLIENRVKELEDKMLILEYKVKNNSVSGQSEFIKTIFHILYIGVIGLVITYLLSIYDVVQFHNIFC